MNPICWNPVAWNPVSWNFAGVACAVLAALALAPQESQPRPESALQSPSSEPLRRVAPQDPRTEADFDAWRARLSVADLGAREAEFDALVERALAGEDARRELESWSQDGRDAEFAWTCRLALREVQSRARHGAWAADPFEDLRRRMFGGDSDPFDGVFIDPLGPFGPFGPHGQSGQPGSSGGGFGRFRLGTPLSPSQPFPGAPNSSGTSRSQGLSLEMGPDGVKVKVQKQENGEQKTEEYTAKSLDELLQAHPELSEQLGGMSLDLGGSRPLRGLRFAFPEFQLDREFAPALRTDRLGVYIQSEPRPEGGLAIEAVQAGSLAQRLGLQRGDVLLELNGRKLASRDDISEELARRAADAPVEVKVRGPDGVETSKTWTPSQDPRGEGRPLAPAPLPGTRKV